MTAITMNIPISVDRVISRMLQSATHTFRTRAATSHHRNKIQADIKQVQELSPHLLRDIGIVEDQILADIVNNLHRKGS